jgi:hypothetical protein
MLSGISGTAHDMLRHNWRQQRHGADVDRIARIGKAIEDFDRAGDLTVKFFTRLSNSEIIEKAEASERAVDDALKS